ncbi:glutamate--tRNA ligase [Oceanithermus sp.]
MVKTRIAPSPTGYPHVGTAYIGIFSYVWARKNGGKFIVRIEDTDRNRYVEGAEEGILRALKWLGLDYDEGPDVGGLNGPYRQSERLELYRRYAQELLDKGLAYRAFETPEELAAIREELQKKGLGYGYDGRARNIPREEAEARAAAGEPHVIRLKTPQTGTTVVHDELRGNIEFDNREIPDVVLLKSDGFPTYHLAVVVDDHLMEVSDVVRGEDWLVSTPTQKLLYEAFGWDEPKWYHLPLLRAPGGAKLSKRTGHTSLDYYREAGYLPEALVNYLSTMGFSMPDGREIFSLEEMIEAFDWGRVSLGGPVFDEEKLRWMSGKYIREVLSLEEVCERLKPFLESAGVSWESDEYLCKVARVMRPRFETLAEFVEKTRYFFSDDYPLEPKAEKELRKGIEILRDLKEVLARLPEFTPEQTEPAIKDFAENKELKLRKVMQPLRAAITGSLATPGMYDLLEVLGKERTLARIERALAQTGKREDSA